MKKSYRSINVFVSHPFEPNNDTYDLETFRKSISLLITMAGDKVKKEHKDFNINITYDFVDFTQELPKQVEDSIKKSHFAIVDITENKPNIFYEYGLLCGLGTPTLIIKGESTSKSFPLPSDIKNHLVIPYDSFDKLLEKCLENVAKQFKLLLHNDSLSNIYLNKIWFPNDAGEIHIVTSTEPDKRKEYSLPESPNYMFLESLGDKDSLLEVMTFLNRKYKNINLRMFAADNYNNNYEDNMVVIGGPGDEDGDANNVCRVMMNKMNLQVCYSTNCEKLLFKHFEFKASKHKKKIIQDYGYFARFPNPFNPRKSVILIHGIHTFGVLGAAKVFSDHPSAQGNIRKLMKKLNLEDITHAAFECFFPVEIIQQNVMCPQIDEKYILPIPK